MAAATTDYLPASPAGERGAFRVDVQAQPRATTVYLAGELDLDSSAYLESVLGEFEGLRSGGLIIDLTELEFIDITGLHVLSRARRTAMRAGRPLTVCNSRDQVRHLLDLVRDVIPQ